MLRPSDVPETGRTAAKDSAESRPHPQDPFPVPPSAGYHAIASGTRHRSAADIRGLHPMRNRKTQQSRAGLNEYRSARHSLLLHIRETGCIPESGSQGAGLYHSKRPGAETGTSAAGCRYGTPLRSGERPLLQPLQPVKKLLDSFLIVVENGRRKIFLEHLTLFVDVFEELLTMRLDIAGVLVCGMTTSMSPFMA